MTKQLCALVFDIDGSIMPQGGPISREVTRIFQALAQDEGLKIGPATGKNCDYARGLACGIGLVWDFVIGETGAQFLETIKKDSPPAFRQRQMSDQAGDLAILAKKIELDIFNRKLRIRNRHEDYRPELKESIITIFPAGAEISHTTEWQAYLDELISTYRLKLKTQRHPDGCIDIVPMAINKRLGLMEVCQLYNLELSQVVTVVDGSNDAELIEGTKCICPSNAKDSIKKLVSQHNGFESKFPDGEGFIDGLRHYASKELFSDNLNRTILEQFGS